LLAPKTPTRSLAKTKTESSTNAAMDVMTAFIFVIISLLFVFPPPRDGREL
jgi:hypothetical protein